MKKKRKFVWQQKIEKYRIFLNIEKLGGRGDILKTLQKLATNFQRVKAPYRYSVTTF